MTAGSGAAPQHAGVAWVLYRSGHASCASQLAVVGGAEWKGVPPLWEVKVLQVPPLWEVKEKQVPPLWEVKVQQVPPLWEVKCCSSRGPA